MTREQAIERMRGAACSKTVPSLLAAELTQATALKLVRHYVKGLAKGATLGGMVEERVRSVSAHRRQR